MKFKKKDGINRRSFVIGGGIILLSPFQIINSLNANQIKRKITFGSCISQDKEQPIWDSIIKEESEAFIFMGDNVYGDDWKTGNTGKLKKAYKKQKNLTHKRPRRTHADEHNLNRTRRRDEHMRGLRADPNAL